QNPDTKHTVEFMYFDMTARDDVQTALNEAISSEFQLRVNENLYAIAGIAREFSDQDPLEVLDHIVGKRSRVDYFHLWFRSTKDFKGEKGVIEAIDYAEALNSSENKSSAISAAYSV